MLSKVRVFFEMIKFEHSIFALPFAYLGLFLAAEGKPSAAVFGWVTGAMVSFRTSAMALNRLIDQEIDARNPRTQNRALPAGALRRMFVWFITAISLGLFALCSYQLNPLCLSLAWIPVLLSILYPFCKRFTWLSHLLLGGILGIAPYGAWLAAGREFSWIPAFLTIGVMAWVAGFDIIYALQDRDFDVKAGLYSFPACFGEKASFIATLALHGAALAAWGYSGILAGLGTLYFVGLGFAAMILVRENWLVRTFGLKRLEQAFFTLNAVVSISLFVFLVADLTF